MILPGMNSGEIEIGLIQLRDPTQLIHFLQDARRSLPSDAQLLTPTEFAHMEQTFWDQSKPIGFIFLFGVGMSLFIGSAILFLVLNTIILLHNDDFATLMALGYTRSRLQRSIFHQSEVVYAVTRMATNLPMAMDSQRIGIVFLFILSSSGASGLLTMRRLQETSPADAFH
jgi:putative ABC transport system permease protein